MMKQEKHEELNYFNAISCLAVILIHVLSYSIVALQKQSWQFAAVFFPWQIAAYVVPAFLFCGAVKLSFQINENKLPSWPVYMKRRIQKVYLPYVVATVVYFLVFGIFAKLELSPKQLLHYLLVGDVSAPLYYIIVVMQFYLLLPLWKWLVQKIPASIALPAAAMIYMLMPQEASAVTQIGVAFRYTDRVFPTYLVFWVLGLYVGKHYESVSDALNGHRKAAGCSMLLVLLFAFVSYRLNLEAKSPLGTGGMKMFSDVLTIIGLLSLCLWILQSKHERVKKLLAAIHTVSFPVYLYHCLFLELGNGALRRLGIRNEGLLLLMRALICYTVPFVLCFAFRACRKRLLSRKHEAA